MDIYTAVVVTTFKDPEALPFGTAAGALAAARRFAAQLGLVEDEELPAGWLFYAQHRTAADAVWVVKKVLDAGV